MASVENGSNATVAQRGELPEWVSCYLTVDQADKVEEAVAHAEKRTSGEIVPVIVRRCVTFKPPTLQLSAVFVLLYCVYAETRISLWMDTQEKIWLGVGLIFAGALAPLLMRSARIRRLMMPDGDAAQIANLRAEAEFYRSGIGSTKDSTGILLFLAIEERQAVVLADKGISAQLPPETWSEVLDLMLNGLKSGKCSDGIIHAVAKCGDILAKHFPIQPDDVNELPNRLVIIG